MQYPGTITLPLEHFTKLLEYAARSFKVHGFRDIVLIGDSGDNQEGQRWGHVAGIPGGHAGLSDTSQLLAVNSAYVRRDKIIENGGGVENGVIGDPRNASAEHGRRGIEMKVEVTVRRLMEIMAVR